MVVRKRKIVKPIKNGKTVKSKRQPNKSILCDPEIFTLFNFELVFGDPCASSGAT